MHNHGHHHEDLRTQSRKRLWVILVMTVGYMALEVVGGWLSNSLALLADAGHMLSDAGALALSLFAFWIADRPPSPRRTYGYYRIEILAAVVHGAALLAISVLILRSAYIRLGGSHVVEAPLMLGVAAGGLVVNLVGIWILASGRSHNLNVRGVWLHLCADALGSLGVLLSALLILFFDFSLADTLVSVLVAILVGYSAWPLLAQAVGVLMESAPGHIDVDQVRDAMAGSAGVQGVHDLHVWCITQGRECLSGHVVADRSVNHQELLQELRVLLQEKFGICHMTIQIEVAGLQEDHVCS